MSRDELNNPTKTRTILIHDAVEIRTTCLTYVNRNARVSLFGYRIRFQVP